MKNVLRNLSTVNEISRGRIAQWRPCRLEVEHAGASETRDRIAAIRAAR